MKQWAKQNGFTIVELLIVIVVIGILAAITIGVYGNVRQRSQTAAVKSDLQQLEKLMRAYRVHQGGLPPGVDFYSGTVMPPPASFSTTVLANMRTAGVLTGNAPEKDPWGQYYWYDNNDCTLSGGTGSSPLKSIGPDGLLSTADDIAINIVTNC